MSALALAFVRLSRTRLHSPCVGIELGHSLVSSTNQQSPFCRLKLTLGCWVFTVSVFVDLFYSLFAGNLWSAFLVFVRVSKVNSGYPEVFVGFAFV